jgi:hypothetical protein
MAGAHTYGGDDAAVLRALRVITIGISVVLGIVGLCLLAAGLTVDDNRIWNLGCTFLIMSGGCGGVTALIHLVERLLRRLDRVMRRLDDVEAGERLIADIVQPDELRRRREG